MIFKILVVILIFDNLLKLCGVIRLSHIGGMHMNKATMTLKSSNKKSKENNKLSICIKKISKNKELLIMLIPSILFYIFFVYKPMFGLQIAFKDFSIFKGVAASKWVGFKHFSTFINSPFFFKTLKNTLLINVYGLLIGFPIPIILALLLNEVKNIRFKKTVQTLTYLPHFVSIVVIAGIVVNFLSPSSGLVNLIIEKFGGEKVYFLTKPQYFRSIFISMNVWKEAGFSAIVYIAALSGIDPQLYEAAYVDGAGKLKRIFNVTIPGLMPTIIILLILKIGKMLTVGFESIILLYQPVTYETADVISTYVYRMGLENSQFDYATAVGLFNSVISLLLVIFANRISRKLSDTSLW
jgi:putative aldouronate transport system permease protein